MERLGFKAALVSNPLFSMVSCLASGESCNLSGLDLLIQLSIDQLI